MVALPLGARRYRNLGHALRGTCRKLGPSGARSCRTVARQASFGRGRQIVRDGQLTNVDVSHLIHQQNKLVEALMA